MYKLFQKSLRVKLLLSFIGISLLPFVLLLIYTLFLGEAKILKKIISEQVNKTDLVISLIEAHLSL
ncbi:MAG: hypothetical protein Q9M40_11245 [Sulfurimonas sp.]|nr:hypothetical protein [Sulfurimonas sp.]